ELRAVAIAGPDIEDVCVDRIDGKGAGFAHAKRGRAIEDRCPVVAPVSSKPDAAPRRADVDDLGVVRADGDRGDLAIGLNPALIDGAGADRRPDGSVQTHCSGFPSPTSEPLALVSSAFVSIDGLTRAPGNRYHCSRASA